MLVRMTTNNNENENNESNIWNIWRAILYSFKMKTCIMKNMKGIQWYEEEVCEEIYVIWNEIWSRENEEGNDMKIKEEEMKIRRYYDEWSEEEDKKTLKVMTKYGEIMKKAYSYYYHAVHVAYLICIIWRRENEE